MRKFIFIFTVLIVSVSSSLAQEINLNEQEDLLKVGLLGPNLEYEFSINPQMTLRTEAGVSLSLGYGGNAIGWLFSYGLFATVSPRFFYNLENRLEDGKSIKNYSGNYLSFVSMAYLNSVLSNEHEPNQYILGPTWGIQRNLGTNWFFNLEIGPAISMSKAETEFVPVIGFDIGIQL